MDLDGNVIGEVVGNNVTYGIFLDRPNQVSYEIPVESRLADIRFTCPYVTDFQYARNNEIMIAGLHTEADISLNGTTLQISGQDWKHYFERRVWPFNPVDPGASFFSRVQVDTMDIARQILSIALAEPGSPAFTINFSSSGILTNYRIEPGDSESILEKVGELSEEKPGFDWIITPDRQIIGYAPEKGTRVEYPLEKGRNIADIALTNNGIRASHVFGFGAGTAKKLGVVVENPLVLRRYDYAQDYGTVIDKDALTRLANRDLAAQSNLSLALTITLMPDAADDFLENVTIGDTVPVTGDVQGYIYINDYYRIVGIEGNVSDNGDETITLTVEIPDA